MVGEGGETPTETAASTVTLADPERVGSAVEVAVTVTPELGTEAGAVYSPVPLTVPTAALPPATPFTLHWTPRFCESFWTVAVNCCVRETFTEADVGATDTLIGAVMEMVAEALFVPSAADVAVRRTVAGLGAFEGALKVTEVLVTLVSVPQVVPVQPLPERDQATPLFWVSFVRVAVNALVPIPACTLVLVGASVMEIGASGAKVMAAALDLVPSRFDVAVSVTAAGLGRAAGAV